MDRHLTRVHAIAWHMLGDRAAAEDVAQETFLRFWQTAPTWKDDGATILTWLRRVATRICIDYRRKKAPIYTDDVPDMTDPAKGADGELIQDEQSRRVRDALLDLNPRQRAAIVLTYYQGVSQTDAADSLGVGVKAYESLLSRGRKTLKNNLMPERESLIS